MTYRRRVPFDTEKAAMMESYLAFLQKLPPGTSHVYHTGAHASGDWCAAARRAYDLGLGALVQRRKVTPSGVVYEYIFQRSRSR
jgi:hypothetical protein